VAERNTSVATDEIQLTARIEDQANDEDVQDVGVGEDRNARRKAEGMNP
jgi:hypothetical protein